MDAAVRISGLNHFYGRGALRKQILFDIETVIHEGEIIITTGPSGSGKTTLLTLVGALRSSQEGHLEVLGEQLTGATKRKLADVRKRIGFIFQQHNLLDAVTAVENVELGLRVTGRYRSAALRARAIEMLEAVGLAERLYHRPEQLSGGQRQRVAIARALASEPAMVLADEPTASLDKASGREVVDRMQTLARENGTTILMVTHDNRILDVADRIIHLEDGRLSSFSESVLANNEHMMGLLADAQQKENVPAMVDALDEPGFRTLLEEMSAEAQRFLDATALTQDHVFQGMLERMLFAFTRKLAALIGAERASLFTVDRPSSTLRLRVTDDLPVHEDIRIPIDTGIVGAVYQGNAAVRVDDAYEDPRFNPEVDKRFGYRTRSVLAVPLHDREGRIFAVAQLLNRVDGGVFDETDQQRLEQFTQGIALMLEVGAEGKEGSAP